jgi:hypothetical protein
MKTILLAAAAAGLVAGCATSPAPTAPSILVLPGSSKTFDQFRADDNECRAYASTQIAGDSTVSLQRRYDYAYQQCMYARGHQVPSTVRPYSSAPGSTPPAPPAGTPPPPPPPAKSS